MHDVIGVVADQPRGIDPQGECPIGRIAPSLGQKGIGLIVTPAIFDHTLLLEFELTLTKVSECRQMTKRASGSDHGWAATSSTGGSRERRRHHLRSSLALLPRRSQSKRYRR